MRNHAARRTLGIRPVSAGIVVLALVAACSAHSAGSTSAPRASSSPTAMRTSISVATAPWQLTQPLSRLVAMTDGPSVVLAGGLTASNTTTNAVERLNVTTGRLSSAGHLAQPVHDAAGAVVNGVPVVFGGGAATVESVVQPIGSGATQRLPQPRADLSAATIGTSTYLVGGYDGQHELASVLATNDGRSFRQIADLTTTVRYGAVAAAAGRIWVFGGSHQGGAVRTIQEIDPQTGTVTSAGKLPTALTDATALTLNNQILVAGGRTAAGVVSGNVYSYDPTTGATELVAQLPVPVANSAAAVVDGRGYLIGGERGATSGKPTAGVQILSAVQVPISAGSTAAALNPSAATTMAPITDSHPFNGRMLIADRGNNRLLLVDAAKQILWTFPNPSAPAPPTGFYFPDDAFFIHHGTGIISNQEGNDTVVEIGFPSGLPLWSYGHPRVAKGAPGYLHEPDDAYLLPSGQVVVADANNCRVVLISADRRQVGQIGTTGDCTHSPPTSLGYPNGDTPLQDGNLLISEVYGSWISEYTLSGQLKWTVHLPITYPSDPQQLGPDTYLVADYAKPGGIYEFNRRGRILWAYHPTSGDAMLNHPSLAEQLPGGFIAANDDYRNRVVIIDPKTNRIVWQYGHTGKKGTAPGYLWIPDGFDLLEPDGSTPTHPYTG